MTNRVCTKCGKEFPLDIEHFRAHPRYSEGFKRQCNWCSYTPEYGRKKQLERRHKMTVEGYEALLASQGDHCALCPAVQGDDKRRMAIDHDHACCDKELTCGECTRGILCADCNRRVAFLEQVLQEAQVTPQPNSWTEKAMRYIDSYKG
jgi:hypothetical protein